MQYRVSTIWYSENVDASPVFIGVITQSVLPEDMGRASCIIRRDAKFFNHLVPGYAIPGEEISFGNRIMNVESRLNEMLSHNLWIGPFEKNAGEWVKRRIILPGSVDVLDVLRGIQGYNEAGVKPYPRFSYSNWNEFEFDTKNLYAALEEAYGIAYDKFGTDFEKEK